MDHGISLAEIQSWDLEDLADAMAILAMRADYKAVAEEREKKKETGG